MESNNKPEQPKYPRIYQAKTSAKIIKLGSSVLYVLVGVTIMLSGNINPANLIFGLVMGIPMVAYGIYRIVYVLRFKIILTQEAFELTRVFKTTRILRSEITGHRFEKVVHRGGSTEYLDMTTSRPGQEKISISLPFPPEKSLKSWFAFKKNIS